MPPNIISDIFLEPNSEVRQDRVVSYHLDFDQRIDERTGQPVGRPVLTQLTARIRRSNGDAVPFYINWMLEHSQQETLSICFYNGHQLVRQITIEDAYLVSYTQDWAITGFIEETLVISPSKMEIDSVPFDRNEAA